MRGRRKLTDAQKDAVLERQDHKCPGLFWIGRSCGNPLRHRSEATFDHFAQLALSGDNSLDNFWALCCGPGSCDDVKTNGPGGEKRTTSYGSDAHARAKHRHLTGKNKAKKKHPIPSRPFQKGKTRWPSRPFPKRIKH